MVRGLREAVPLDRQLKSSDMECQRHELGIRLVENKHQRIGQGVNGTITVEQNLRLEYGKPSALLPLSSIVLSMTAIVLDMVSTRPFPS